MSYCRWSSDDFQCDLYCYEDERGGWTTHVATLRIEPKLTPMPTFSSLGDKPAGGNWLVAYRKQAAELKAARHVPIGLPFDGRAFNDSTLEDFRDRLLELRAVGYRFPDYVLERINDELKERKP